MTINAGPTPRQVAERIAEKLFRNEFNQAADRLVLELPGKRDGGGWCRGAVVDLIEGELRRCKNQQ